MLFYIECVNWRYHSIALGKIIYACCRSLTAKRPAFSCLLFLNYTKLLTCDVLMINRITVKMYLNNVNISLMMLYWCITTRWGGDGIIISCRCFESNKLFEKMSYLYVILLLEIEHLKRDSPWWVVIFKKNTRWKISPQQKPFICKLIKPPQSVALRTLSFCERGVTFNITWHCQHPVGQFVCTKSFP